MKRLAHPNICQYRDSFLTSDKGTLCIVMGYCDGGDLAGYLKNAKGKRLSEHKILQWFSQLALGLHYMHKHFL